MSRFRSTKTYCHNIGLSCAFRQHRATSHCRFIHGYALQVRIEFEADALDERNWVIDFGSLKPVKAQIESLFDHRTLVAVDDPDFATFQELHRMRIIQMRPVEAVGVEAFAKEIGELVIKWLAEQALSHNPRLALIEVAEHGGNSALWIP